MRIFAVYHHPLRGYEAVKNGFSWPGFFFTWIWAFVKGLPEFAVPLLFVFILSGALVGSRRPFLLALGVGGLLCVALAAGIRGNRWREKTLTRRGYRLMEILREKSPDAAISKILESASLEKTIEDSVIRALERKEGKGDVPEEAA